MHAVVFQVDVKPDWEGDGDAELDAVVGFVKSAHGFVRGTWTTDGRHGLSFIMFEAEGAAREFAANAAIPPRRMGAMKSSRPPNSMTAM